jgi:hypothetical protein
MSGKRDSARNALRRAVPFLAERHHDDILNELDNESLLDGEGKTPNGGRVHAVAGDAPKGRPLLTPMQASQAKQENASLVKQILATAARMNIDIDPTKVVDVPALNRALVGRSVDERLAMKSMLARLHLIP